MSILVYTEHIKGKLKKQSSELVSYAYQVGKAGNQKVIAVATGDIQKEELEKLSVFGASKIIHVNSPHLKVLDNRLYTKVLAEIAEKENAQMVIMANSFTGKALAPGLAVRLKAGLLAGVVDLPESSDNEKFKKIIFNGKAFAHVKANTTVKVITLNNNACQIQENQLEAEWEEFTPQIAESDVRTHQLEVDENISGSMLTEASIVVSGGRGMRSPDNWGPLEELAQTLNAALACSKPVSDEGWRPHEEHVGQTGKTIAPDLYIAAGISGAVQHLAGVSSSKTIVAINTDKEAPIFEIADYGIIGDAIEVLPKFIQSVKKLQAS